LRFQVKAKFVAIEDGHMDIDENELRALHAAGANAAPDA